jgi:hypothetical protein
MAWKKWVGVGMILLSGVWFAGIFTVPFTAFSLAIKAVLGLVFLVLMEVFFWVGSVIVGKQAISHSWSRFKKRKSKTEDQATGATTPIE